MPTKNLSQERRKWQRLPLAIPVFIRCRDRKGNDLLEFATALNVSAGGMLLAVRRMLPSGAQYSLEIPSGPTAEASFLSKSLRILKARSVRVAHAPDHHLLAVKFARPLSV